MPYQGIRTCIMGPRFKVFLAGNVLVAILIMFSIYFELFSPSPPLCDLGRFSFLSFIRSFFGFQTDRWLIYVCDYGKNCGELPQRLDGIMSAYLLSVLTSRKFGIYFRKPASLEQYFQPANMSWIINPGSLTFHSCEYYSYMHDSKFVERLKTVHLNSEFPEEVIYIKLSDYHWTALYENSLYRESVRQLGYTASGTFHQTFIKLFEPKADFKQTIRQYSNTFKSQLSTNLVCVISGSETVNQVNEWHGLWTFLDQYKSSSDTRILMTSEDSELVMDAKQRYPDRFTSIPGGAGLIDGEITSGDSKLRKHMEMNFLDLYSLIQCDVLVMMCRNDFGRVVAFSRNSNQGLFYFQNGTVREIDLDTLSMDYEEKKCVPRNVQQTIPRVPKLI